MKKSYINLHHHHHSQIPLAQKHQSQQFPSTGIYSPSYPYPSHSHSHSQLITVSPSSYSSSLFRQLPQSALNKIAQYLRLAEIVTLYSSLKYSHKYQQLKRYILNYFILTNRKYSKWEEKEFLDFVMEEWQGEKKNKNSKNNNKERRSRKNSQYCNNDNNSSNNVDNQHQGMNSRHASYFNNTNYNNNLCVEQNQSNPLITNNSNLMYNQSIINDVDRTYFIRSSKQIKNRRKQLFNPRSIIQKQQIDNKNNQNNQNNNNNNNHETTTITNPNQNQNLKPEQPYQYFITLSTEPVTKQSTQTLLQLQNNNNNNAKSQCTSQYSYSMSHSCQQNNDSCWSRVQYSNTPTHSHNSNNHAHNNNCNSFKNKNLAHYSSQQKMQNYLKNVLIKISQKYTLIGYIQGFNYIVKNMYLTGFQQQQAINYLSYFIQYKKLGKIILSQMHGIRKLSYVLKVYMFNYIPKIYFHLQNSQVQPQIFCTSWFITLFSQDLSVDIVNKIWHLFVLQGWKVFIVFGISFLCGYQEEILRCEPGEIFQFMRRIMERFNQQIRVKDKQREYYRRNNVKSWNKQKYNEQHSTNQPLRKDQIIWKLMTSVQVNNEIVSQLCKQMQNLKNDSQIQIWRIQAGNKRINLSRNRRIHSQSQNQSQNKAQVHSQAQVHVHDQCQSNRSLYRSQVSQKSNRSYNSNYSNNNLSMSMSMDFGITSQICCDRVHCTDNNNSINNNSNNGNRQISRPNNFFMLCHDVNTYVQ